MDAIKQHLVSGSLDKAINDAGQQVRSRPGDAEARASLIELLCVAGDLERADEMLGALARHHPDWLAGAANLRQLMRAQQARAAFHQGQLAEDVVAGEGDDLQALLALMLARAEGDLDAAEAAAQSLEEHREKASFRLGDVEGDIRDCDDSLCGFIEALGTDGKFYLWRWSEIEAIDFHPPGSPVELAWRRADVELTSGQQGEVFVPLIYQASTTDQEKLGRVTDWQEHSAGLVTGVGLKQFLVGDDVVGLESVSRVERLVAANA
ncbi:type VI secretion system accessory protein TagJ [Marinobacter fuscus]|nr:type VI secretion system accessory protein TagJ [Marinobacter fuscus]